MKKIKVLHMPLVNTKGGVEQYVLKNWQFIDKEKYQFDIITRSVNHNCLEPVCQGGGEIFTYTRSSDEDEQQFRNEMLEILKNGYDVIHLHTSYWKGFLMEELARTAGCPTIIVHAHSTAIDVADDDKREKYLQMHEKYKKLFRPDLADYYLACSKKAGDWIFGEQIPKSSIKIMNNAIDLELYRYNSQIRLEKRKSENLEAKFVIGNVARFSYQKNHDFLLEMMAELRKVIPEMCVLLIGDGPLKEPIEYKARQVGLEDCIRFYGEREDVPELLQAMDAFVLPSRFEGLPITLIEAQAAGLPCIAYEYITDEADITGNVTFLPYDITSWCEKLVQIRSDFQRKSVNESIKAAGYDIRSQIHVLETLYQSGITRGEL